MPSFAMADTHVELTERLKEYEVFTRVDRHRVGLLNQSESSQPVQYLAQEIERLARILGEIAVYVSFDKDFPSARLELG